jgi:hypothetical protein
MRKRAATAIRIGAEPNVSTVATATPAQATAA